MLSVIGDITDAHTVNSVFERSVPELVIHLAAQSLVRASYEDPIGTYVTNVIGTGHVLEAVRHSDARVAVVVTSDKCYENKERLEPYREDDPLGGRDPYSNSKACAELLTAAYRTSFFAGPETTRIASARAGNVIGGGDWAEGRLVPDLVRAGLKGEPALIRNPDAVRPWQHVLDCLSGYLTLAEAAWSSHEFAGAWNFGPQDDPRPVSWFCDAVAERWPGLQWSRDTGKHPPEAGLLQLDSTKAKGSMSWRQRLELEEAIDWTIEWYLAMRDGRPVRETVEDQLDRYAEIDARDG